MIQQLISEKMPDQLKLSFALWTRTAPVKTPVQRMPGSRFATNMISTITNQGKVPLHALSGNDDGSSADSISGTLGS